MAQEIYCVENLVFEKKEELENRYSEVNWNNLTVGYADEDTNEWVTETIHVFEIIQFLGRAFSRKWFIARDKVTGEVGILFVRDPQELPNKNWYFYLSIRELAKDIIANQKWIL